VVIQFSDKWACLRSSFGAKIRLMDELTRLKQENQRLRELIEQALSSGDSDYYFGTQLAGEMRRAISQSINDD
jgi:cell shape-determining protein MreC